MTRWCPVCESRGRPVVQGELSVHDIEALRSGTAVRVRDRLPGIVPSHMCSACPTYFRGRDRFYLTARHEETVHGIAVWPHRQRRVRIESGDDGMVFVVDGTSWVWLTVSHVPTLLNDFFWGYGQREIISWSRRRGFSIHLVPDGDGRANMTVSPAGPHFGLLVAKSWAQENDLRSTSEAVEALVDIGLNPLVFEPS